MCSKIADMPTGTAAWRISLWSGVAFAIGTALAFLFLQNFLAHEIQSRADSWLTGELGTLADVAERTPVDQLHDTVVREVAELASREVPREEASGGPMDRAVFFVQTTKQGKLKLHTGAGAGPRNLAAIEANRVTPDRPTNISLAGFGVPFRVAEAQLANGDRVYLALSTEYERKVLRRLRVEFALLWFGIIALGTTIVFVSTRRMLHRIQVITDTAASIGRTNLSSRVPVLHTNDEISRLSSTLNRMLDRVEASVQQLHAMSDALAHDLRSPLTSLRGKLEFVLTRDDGEERELSIAQCIEQVDRMSSLLNTSLDVSEASADALRLRKELIDVDQTVRSLVELYEPAFAHAGLTLSLRGSGPAYVLADPGLLQRTVANLLENDLKYLAPGNAVSMQLERATDRVRLTFEDNGEGFPPDLLPRIFERYTRGPRSEGFGLGLAFVSAVVRSHDGSVVAENQAQGGACVRLELPMAAAPVSAAQAA